VLLQPGLQQPSQRGEALGQLPAGQRRSLVQRACLLFEQRQIVQWVVDHRLAFVAARMAGDDFARARDRHLMNIAPHQHPEMPVAGRHRVVVAAIADQRQRTDPGRDLFAGLIRRDGKRQQRCPVTLEALADRLRVPAQPPLPPLAALCLELNVPLLPAGHARNRHHEVPPRISDQSFHLALIVALPRTSELVGEQIVALELGERSCSLSLLAAEDLRHSDLAVVVKDARGYAAEVCERTHMTFQEGFSRLGRERRHEAVIGVGQVHHQVVRLPLHTGNHRKGFAEVHLRLARCVDQRHEHLPSTQRCRPHVVLDDRVAAVKPVLFPKPVEDPLGCMPLLYRSLPVIFQDGVDDAQPRPQLRSLHRLHPLISRRNRIAKHLLDRLARDPELPRYLSLAPSLHQHQTPHTPIELHSEHPSGVP